MIFAILGVISAIVAIAYLANQFSFSRVRAHWEKHGIPFYRTKGLSITNLKVDFLKVMINDYKTITGGYGGVRTFFKPALLVKDPELIKKILIKDFDHFINRREVKFDKVFENMLSILKDKEWKDMRTIMSPTFTTGKIRRMFENFQSVSEQFVQYLRTESISTDEIDMRDCFNRITSDSIATAAFGFQTDSLMNKEGKFIRMVQRVSNPVKGAMLRALIFLTFPRLAKILRIRLIDFEAVEFFKSVVKSAISSRKESKEKRDDFINLMLEAKSGELNEDEDKDEKEKVSDISQVQKQKLLSDDMILSQAFLFLVAGFSTVEVLLSFACYEMLLNPDMQQRIFEESQKACEDGGGKLTFDEVNKMEFMDRFVSEILRKYPPAVALERKCNKDYPIPGTNAIIPKDTLIGIPVYAIHMDEEYYPNPEKFDPDRFLSTEKAKRSSAVYLPFGSGPRNCIGVRFALTEAKVILANLALNFEIVPCKKTQIPLVVEGFRGTPTPEKGVFVKLIPRS